MLANITIINGNVLTRSDFITYRAQLANVSEDLIKQLMRRCETGETEFPPDFPEQHYQLAETICADISRSGGEVDPVAEETILQHTHAETPAEAYLVVSEPKSPSGPEMAILEAARSTNLFNGWDKLKDLFDFGENFDQLSDRGPVSPQDLASAMGYGASMTKAGVFVTAKAMLRLQAMGWDDVVTQYASEKGLGYSTVSGWLRMESRIPAGSEARKLLHPSAIAEITNAKYSSNEEEDKKLREEVLREACEMRADTSEARSLVLKAKGSKDRPEEPSKKALSERVKALEGVLRRILANVPESDNSAFLEAVRDARELFRDDNP